VIVSTANRFFCPFSGYFSRAIASDVFVVLDSVQFPRGTTWITEEPLQERSGDLVDERPGVEKGARTAEDQRVKICREGDGRGNILRVLYRPTITHHISEST